MTKMASVWLALVLLCGLVYADPVVKSYQPEKGKNFQVTTSASGSTWVQLPDVICDRVIIPTSVKTGTSVPIEVRQGSTDTFGMVLPANAAVTVRGFQTRDCNELWIRRADESNTQVTIVIRTEIGGF
jgi:hypothetical protein